MKLACAFLLSALAAAQRVEPEVLAEWAQVDYEWTGAERQAALDSKDFIPENNAVTGVKVCGQDQGCESERVFATVPRWANGVPATLSEVVKSESGADLLRPWPSREAQDPRNCSAIQYVQSMEIDLDGVMWVLDVGRKYFAPPSTVAEDNSCPPKIMLIDIQTASVLSTYVFPNDVAPHDGSFLNDIVLDLKNRVAFISSTGNPDASDKGAIVIYDDKKKRSRRFESEATRTSQDTAPIVIHSTNQTDNLRGLATDGIALTPSCDKVFFSPLGGRNLYSVSAEALRDFDAPVSAVVATLEDHGFKPDNCDGMTFDDKGDLYFGGLTTDSVYRWTPGTGPPVKQAEAIATDPQLWWVDTFAFDGRGSMVVTSNRLDRWFFGGMDFSGAAGANFRISKLNIGRDSYMSAEQAQVFV